VFKVYLPRVSSPHDINKQKVVSGSELSGDETILLVEDEETVRRMARTILENHGYSVLEAAEVNEAFRLCVENLSTIDLVLTDVIMPGMSGRMLAERIARLSPKLPVVYMSGYTDDAIVRHGILEENIIFLQKPFTPESLIGKVREALSSPVRTTA